MLKKFFKSMEITNDGILLMIDSNGKNTGDAYIQFSSQEHAEQALMKHKEAIEKRFVSFKDRLLSSEFFGTIKCSNTYF